MSRAERPYIRIYHDDLLRDYPHVWNDDAALAAFNRLLVVADKMWPILPELPRSVSRRALAVLNQPNARGARLVELEPAHCYRIRGHDTERQKRQDSARNAAGVRWDSERNAASTTPGNADAMPKPKPSQDETNTPPPQAGRRKDKTNPRALGTNPRAQGTSPRQIKATEKRGPVSIAAILRAAAEGRSA